MNVTRIFVPWISVSKGKYVKQFYDVRTKDGQIEKHFWPNAGHLHSVHNGKIYKPDADVEVSPSLDHPEDFD